MQPRRDETAKAWRRNEAETVQKSAVTWSRNQTEQMAQGWQTNGDQWKSAF
jgi:hypothetical protein